MTDFPKRESRQVGVLSLIAVIMVLAGLKLTTFISMPMGLTFLAAALVWPIQVKLEKKLPRIAAVFISLFLVVTVLVATFMAIVFMIRVVGEDWRTYAERLNEILANLLQWAQVHGIELTRGEFDLQSLGQEFLAFLQPAAVYVFGLVGALFLFIAYLLLLLLEVPEFEKKLKITIGTSTSRKMAEAAARSAHNVRNFMYALGLVSAATGVLVGLFTWFIGLQYPLVWGLLAFALNFIPTLGSIVSVIPPTLLAVIQPGSGIGLVMLTLIGLTLIQFTMGNYIAPKLEGRFLALSPLVVLFSIGFWGFIWGIPGAFLGVPLTAAAVVFCDHFEPTRWLAELLGEKAAKKPEPSELSSEKET